MSDFSKPMIADTTDPGDVVLWIGNDFAGNVGIPVSEVGRVFDVDAAVAVEIARRWNGFAALEAELLATCQREAATHARHDAKIAALEAGLAAADRLAAAVAEVAAAEKAWDDRDRTRPQHHHCHLIDRYDVAHSALGPELAAYHAAKGE